MYNKDKHVLQFCDGTNWNPMGKVWTGSDGGGCTGPPSGSAGNIIYNKDYCVLQYCDSSKWQPIGHPHARDCNNTCGSAVLDCASVCGGTAVVDVCTGCGGAPPSVGTVCTDGTVYAGLSTDTGTPRMYTQRCDIGMSWSGSACTGTRTAICWNNCNNTGLTTTNVTNANTGQSNTATLVTLDSDSGVAGTQPHVAAQTCVNLNEDGHTDWYLPAKNELNVMYTGAAAIGNFETTSAYYWTSSENASTFAWGERFSDGNQANGYEFNALDVRCVRR